jgi:hypothetical protein
VVTRSRSVQSSAAMSAEDRAYCTSRCIFPLLMHGTAQQGRDSRNAVGRTDPRPVLRANKAQIGSRTSISDPGSSCLSSSYKVVVSPSVITTAVVGEERRGRRSCVDTMG